MKRKKRQRRQEQEQEEEEGRRVRDFDPVPTEYADEPAPPLMLKTKTMWKTKRMRLSDRGCWIDYTESAAQTLTTTTRNTNLNVAVDLASHTESK
jgi:hypothetical protein